MLELQRVLIGDKIRNETFYNALQKVIKPGVTTVTDIGSGTGFLSFLASRLGARECHLYEYTDLLHLSKKIAEANGIKNCRFVHAHTREVKKPPRVDLVISETLGNFALEENIIENMEDAKRFLKKGGVLMPLRLRQYVIPVIHPRLIKELGTWNTGLGINLSFALEASLNNMYVRYITPVDVLQGADAVVMWDNLDFYAHNKSIRRGNAKWHFKKQHIIYGFCIFWECDLAEGITLSTSPYAPQTHWEQIFLPVRKTLRVNKNDELAFSIVSDSRYSIGLNVRWNVEKKSSITSQSSLLTMDMRIGLN